MADGGPHPFEWLLVVGAFASFCFSFGTGSNDVANAFATSVGSGALTMGQAMIIAVIFEFTGSLVLGQTNVDVIAGGIVDRGKFSQANSGIYGPYLFAYGMMWVMLLGGLFQLGASFLQLNVSATHSVIGGIIGFGVAHGQASVIWITDKPLSFPPYGGIVPIVISWFFSPVFCGIGSFILFMTVRTLVLRSANPVKYAYVCLPILILVTLFVECFFVFTKGAKTQLQTADGEWTLEKSIWISAVCAACCAAVSIMAIPFIMKRVEQKMEVLREEAANPKSIEEQAATDAMYQTPKGMTFIQSIQDVIWFNPNSLDPATKARLLAENEVDEFDPSKAEKFDVEAEVVFSYLQVVTAIAVIFAHGANEVGYATGPLSTIWDVVNGGTMNTGVGVKVSAAAITAGAPAGYIMVQKYPTSLASKTQPPYWIIFLCAAGLCCGLGMYGQRLTWAVANKLAKLSPSRGFAAELSTAIVITIAAQYGMPTSSSQVLTGGIVGVGCAEGISGVNWWYFFKNFWGWVFTMFAMGIAVGLCYAQGAFSPVEVNP